MGNEKTVRIGIIGCGGIANGKHMPSLRQIPGVQMVAFCDIIEERARKAKQDYGTPDAAVYTDYRKLLEDKTIDVVHVCTPNRSHSFISIDALRAGKETGKLLTIGYQSRQRADAQYMKQECLAGTFGDIYYAKATAIRRRAVPTWGVFLNEYEQGGGPLIDIGTHALDLTLWMMDNYKPKYCLGQTFHKLNKDTNQGNAWGNWDPEKFTVEDSAFGMVVMENGAVINLESAWALNTLDVREAVTTICGTRAGADMDDGLRINGIRQNCQYVFKPNFSAAGAAFFDGVTSADPAVLEAAQWINAVVNDGTPCVLPEQAFTVTRILEGIYTSAKTGNIFRF